MQKSLSHLEHKSFFPCVENFYTMCSSDKVLILPCVEIFCTMYILNKVLIMYHPVRLLSSVYEDSREPSVAII